ncbi:hypothetical protein ACFPM0_03720 [Pseudonocardia sulfidoxydans]|uniref:hypothetical protein n=1 Tax=Pseudonocardia sulfidoxydans TaxID=54011 RepID=UPI003619334A
MSASGVAHPPRTAISRVQSAVSSIRRAVCAGSRVRVQAAASTQPDGRGAA